MTNLGDLPPEILHWTYTLIDIPSLCQFYVAFSGTSVALPAVDIFQHQPVPVSTVPVVSGDDEAIDFDTLKLLPPCWVQMESSIVLWPLTVYHLNQIPIHRLSLIMDFDMMRMNGALSAYTGHIDSLTIQYAKVTVGQDIPRGITDLTISDSTVLEIAEFEKFTKLTSLTIENCLHDFTQTLRLSPSVSSVSLPFHWEYEADTFTGVTSVSVGYLDKLPWHQLKRILHGGIPDINSLENMEVFAVTHTGPRTSFHETKCPKLKEAEVVAFIQPRSSDITTIFTVEQLSQLTSLRAWGYTIRDPSMLKSVTQLMISLEQPLTENFKLPPLVDDLSVLCQQAVAGIPPQVKKCTIKFSNWVDWHQNFHVNIKSEYLIDLAVLSGNNVSIDAPNLVNLNLRHRGDILKLIIPKVVKMNIQGRDSSPDFKEYLNLEIVNFQSVTGEKWPVLDSLRKYEQIEYEGYKLDGAQLWAHAIKVHSCESLTNSTLSAKLVVVDQRVRISNCIFDGCVDLRCGSIEQLPATLEKVSLWGWGDANKARSIPPDVFNNTPHVRMISFTNSRLACDRNNPILIPATVKVIVMDDVLGDEIWLKFAPNSQLEHIEIAFSSWYADSNDGRFPYFTLDTLGLDKSPRSIYAPHMAATGEPKRKRMRIA